MKFEWVILETAKNFKDIQELERLRVIFLLYVPMISRSRRIYMYVYILQMLRLDVFKKILISNWSTSKTLTFTKGQQIKSTEGFNSGVSIYNYIN